MNFYKNIQIQQNINLFLLLLLAYFQNSLQISFLFLIFFLGFTITLELLLNKIFYHHFSPPFGAINTAFGIVLMIGWSRWYIPFVLITAALLQKKLIKVKNKHIFNPSNFAVIFALLFFYPKALPLLGQLGKEYFAIFIIIALAFFILIRVKRLAISLSFIIFYILFEYFFIGGSDPTWHFSTFLTKFFSTSFIVYIFFMLTDPLTTPQKTFNQIVFALFVALLVAFLDFFDGMHVRNLFIALFLSSFFRVFIKLEHQLFWLFIISIVVLYLYAQKPMVFYYSI